METRVYGGKPTLIHVDDGKRAQAGKALAEQLDYMTRLYYSGDRTEEERKNQPLCPGCYMIVAFNMLLELAERNGQSRTELARSMRNAFDELLANPEAGMTEEMEILLDPCEV